MPLDFNPEHYSNNFPGEIIESDVSESKTNGKQYLRIVIATLDHDGDKMVQAVPCRFPDCTAQWIHRHQPFLWEDTGTSTWLFKFIDSVNDKTRGNFNTKRPGFNHKEFLGKRFMWEPVESKGTGGKRDDGTRYDQVFMLVASPYEKEASEEIEFTEPLVTAAPVNGTNGTVSKVMVDPDLTLASYADGKKFTDITNAVQQLMDIFEPNYVVNEIMRQDAFVRLSEKGLLKEEDGVYHASMDAINALVGDAELKGK